MPLHWVSSNLIEKIQKKILKTQNVIRIPAS